MFLKTFKISTFDVKVNNELSVIILLLFYKKISYAICDVESNFRVLYSHGIRVESFRSILLANGLRTLYKHSDTVFITNGALVYPIFQRFIRCVISTVCYSFIYVAIRSTCRSRLDTRGGELSEK